MKIGSSIPSLPGGEGGKAHWVWIERLFRGKTEAELKTLCKAMSDPEGRPLKMPRKDDVVGLSKWKHDVFTLITKNDLLHPALSAVRLRTNEDFQTMQRECRRRGAKPVPNVAMMPAKMLKKMGMVQHRYNSARRMRSWHVSSR